MPLGCQREPKDRCKVDLDKLLSDVDLDEMLRLYDEAAAELMQVAISDGHFADRDPSEITWPMGSDLDALTRRAELIGTIHEGIPRSATSACKRHTTTTSASVPRTTKRTAST